MIQLEYDEATAGTRISFVLKDGPSSLNTTVNFEEIYEGSVKENSKLKLPQTPKSLDFIIQCAEHMKGVV